MKRFCWFILFLAVFLLPTSAQKNSDYGIFGGVSSYFGDINTSRYFYSPSPSFGIIYRHNFNPRQAVRTSFIYGGLKGNDLDFDNAYQQTRAASFTNSVAEWSAQYEFNFFSYSTTGKWWDYTPYFAGGFGLAFISSPTLTYIPVIPLSIGFKINVYKNMGLEAEYGFRKTFYDNFDGLNDNIDPDDHSWAHNNDWYMFAGVTFTWKMFHNLGTCPTYYDVVKTKRRPR
jgi:hypothetical protein